MYFTADTPLFRYEIMMQGIPNFLPRGHGIHVTVTKVSGTVDCEYCLFFNRKKCTLPRCPYIEDKIRTGTASIRQIMTETMSEIHCEHFWDRLNQYIKESENSRMNYCNKKHEMDFNKALEHGAFFVEVMPILKKIYVCSRYAGETDKNVINAREYCGFVSKICGAVPVAPHIYFTQFLDDAVPEERAFGRMVGLQLLSECDELWYFGDQISQGMVADIIAAKEQGIPVRYISQKDIEKMTNNGGIFNEN